MLLAPWQIQYRVYIFFSSLCVTSLFSFALLGGKHMTKCIYCIICYASGTRLGLFPWFVLFLLPPFFCFVFSPFCVTAMLCILSNLESLQFWWCVWGRSLLKEKTSPPFPFHRGLGISRRKVKHPTLGGFQQQHGISFWGAPDLPEDSIGLPPPPAWLLSPAASATIPGAQERNCGVTLPGRKRFCCSSSQSRD